MRYLILCLLFFCGPAMAEATVRYIANAGLLVRDGNSKILFDPLFDNDYGQYYLPPDDIREAILAGIAPFDDIDAVFISHAHSDHFSAADYADVAEATDGCKAVRTSQVADSLKEAANGGYAEVFDRITGLTLNRGDPPVSLEEGKLSIEAINISHSGWPDRWAELNNLAFRVTLADGNTVLHLGDADTRDEHYALQPDHWTSRQVDTAFPPYWYFLSSAGRQILDERLNPAQSIGVHVPKDIPRDRQGRPQGLRDVDLFTTQAKHVLLARIRASLIFSC